jgi:anti-anti-sigma regulatory factor
MGVSAVQFVVRVTITRADIPALCARLADLLRGRSADVVECDVGGIDRPDVVTVEALARLALTARRHGGRLVVTGAGPDLFGLFGLLGLTELLAPAGPGPETGEPDPAPSGPGPEAGGPDPAPSGPGPGTAARASGSAGRRQVSRQAEEREQAGGVQEVVDGRDPPV